MPQTKKQKQEKALAYWLNKFLNDHLVNQRSYIVSQIRILERKLNHYTFDISLNDWYFTSIESTAKVIESCGTS